MNAWVLHAPSDQSGAVRWGISAAIIVALHILLIALGVSWYTQSPPPGSTMPTILVDLSPAPSSAAPEPQQMDLAPGPDMQQADAPEPPKQETVEEQIAPTPPQEKPVVAAPPEQKTESKPEPPKPVPVKPKPIRKETKKPADTPPAPRTSAAPKAERRAPAASATTAGVAAAAAALPAYRDLLAAHLQRFKQYPSGAKAAGEQGTAMLSFTVNRNGQVMGSRLVGSSGHPALDAETLAMIRRAQPLPSFPPELKQASMSFTVPVRFSLR